MRTAIASSGEAPASGGPSPLGPSPVAALVRRLDPLAFVERVDEEAGGVTIHMRPAPEGCVLRQLLLMTIEGAVEAAGFGLPRMVTARGDGRGATPVHRACEFIRDPRAARHGPACTMCHAAG